MLHTHPIELGADIDPAMGSHREQCSAVSMLGGEVGNQVPEASINDKDVPFHLVFRFWKVLRKASILPQNFILATMFSPSTLCFISLLAAPSLSFVLLPDIDLPNPSQLSEPNTFATHLTSPTLSNNNEDTIQTLTDLNLTALTSKNTIALTRIQGSLNITTSSSHLLRRANPNPNTTALRATGSSFLAPITLGGQTFNVIVDTGSSDTWLVNSSFTCVNQYTNQTRDASECRFGGAYDTSKQGTGDGDKFKKIDNMNFNVTYGDGEFLTGVFGTIDVTIADVKVPGQQIALASLAAWQGDNRAAGLLGLGYPALTGAYLGNDPRMDRYCRVGQKPGNGCNQVEYDPLLTNAFFDSRVATPVFSLALSRDESRSGKGGYLSIGGIPDLEMVNAEGGKKAEFASTNVTVLRGDDRFRYYLVQVDGVVVGPAGSEGVQSSGTGGAAGSASGGQSGSGSNGILVRRRERDFWRGRRTSRTTTTTTTTTTKTTTNQRTVPSTTNSKTSSTSSKPTSISTTIPSSQPTTLTNSQNTPLILDSGTTLSYLPPSQTRKILSLYSPPGIYNSTIGYWVVSCTATPPATGIKIGGRIFYANPKDMVKKYDASTCISGVQEASGSLQGLGVGILGDTWLDSVLVVFDFRAGTGADRKGGGVVRVAARREYAS